MKRTVAEHLGSTPHVSPLLRKLRRLGLSTSDALLGLAAVRGCTHYAPPGWREFPPTDPGGGVLSDLELAIALCSGAQDYDPRLLRCAAQLMSAENITPTALARASRMERCETVVGYIADAAKEIDVGHEEFWLRVLAELPVRRHVPPAGVLPHPSRFTLATGLTSPRRAGSPRRIWLRPQPAR
jgi:hypothetical protein